MGLKVKIEKTKVMRIDAKNQELIIIAGQGIAAVDGSLTWESTVC